MNTELDITNRFAQRGFKFCLGNKMMKTSSTNGAEISDTYATWFAYSAFIIKPPEQIYFGTAFP